MANGWNWNTPIPHACVPAIHANELKKFLTVRTWLLLETKPTRLENDICFPLSVIGTTPEALATVTDNFPDVHFQEIKPKRSAWTRPRTLTEALRGVLPVDLEPILPKSWDIIGHLAIVELPKISTPELQNYWGSIGQAIILVNPIVTSVFLKDSAVQGEFRTRNLRCIAGPDMTETVHKENGCTFRVDVRKVFFTPRLVTERARIALLPPNANELVFDMFAGVGPFAVERAKTQGVPVIAADKNPAAIYYLEKNVVANHVTQLVTPTCADAGSVGKWPLDKVLGQATRVIMNLPERSLEFIPQALAALRPEGGTLHIYQFCFGENAIQVAVQRIDEVLRASNAFLAEVLAAKVVKPYAPHEFLTVVDTRVIPG